MSRYTFYWTYIRICRTSKQSYVGYELQLNGICVEGYPMFEAMGIRFVVEQIYFYVMPQLGLLAAMNKKTGLILEDYDSVGQDIV